MKKFLKITGIVIAVLLLGAAIAWYGFLKPAPPPISEADRARLSLIPLPSKLEYHTSGFSLGQGIKAELPESKSGRLERAVDRFKDFLELQSGVSVPIAQKSNLVFRITTNSTEYPQLGVDESYHLEVEPDRIFIEARTEFGAIHALETLSQLVERADHGWEIPAVSIEDSPRYPWRGLMVDVCRHWVPKEVILRIVDGMASVKMNVLHLHLTEYQGFRVESKRYPKLHELGSDGEFYTQEDLKEIIEFAADRGIRVVPEFDLPGHSTSWFVGYPELASAPGPYELDSIFGILEPVMDPTREEVYDFLDEFFDEMTDVFPDEYLHIGGDEVNASHWQENEAIQDFMKEKEFLDEHALQAYFNQRLQKILQSYNRKMLGWDEIIHPDLPKDGIAVQSWRSPVSLWEAARGGNKAILSSGYYLDYKQPASYHYNVDPLVIPGAIDIDIDSTNWKSWDVTMYFNETEIEGSIFIFGDAQDRGLMSFMDTNQGITPTIEGNQIKFSHSTNFGEVSYDLATDGDSISGNMNIALFNLELKGIRSGGTDMNDGIELPEFKKIEPLTPEQQVNILGGEACMWSEMVDKTTIESRIWPRAAAIAEKLWSRQELTTDSDDFNRRLLSFDEYLLKRGSGHRKNTHEILSKIVETRFLEVSTEFVNLLHEDKFFNRMSLYGDAGLNTKIPLKRVVDAAPAQSLKGLEFEMMVDEWLKSGSDEVRTKLIKLLRNWKNLAVSVPFDDFMELGEVQPHATTLIELCDSGILVLSGEDIDQKKKDQQISRSKTAHGGTLLAVSSGFERLLNYKKTE